MPVFIQNSQSACSKRTARTKMGGFNYCLVCLSFLLTFLTILPSISVAAKHGPVFLLPLKRLKKDTNTENSLGIGRIYDPRLVKRAAPTDSELKNMKNNLNGFSGDGYYIDIEIGTPPQRMQVLIDTGSANFAIAAEFDRHLSKYFDRTKSSTYEEDGQSIYVPYTEGEWTGVLGKDVVSFPFALNLTTKTNIAFITAARDFFVDNGDWQGILGLAYSALSLPDPSLQPFWDSVMEQHPDIANVFSVQLCGSSFFHSRDRPLMEGSLILGGVVPSMSKSNMFYTPIYKKWYYEVVITDIAIGGKSLQMECKEYNFDKTIVDTGTTCIRLPNAVFNMVVQTIHLTLLNQTKMDIPGEDFYGGDSMMCFRNMSLPFTVFPVVSISLMETDGSYFTLHLTAQHYLRPVASIDSMDETCVKFGFAASTQGTVLGAVLMEAFYVVFDRENSRIGFAQTTCPLPDPTNPILKVTIEGPVSAPKNLSSCAYQKPDDPAHSFLVASYVLTSIAVVVLFPVALLMFFSIRRRCSRRCQYEKHEESETVLTD